MSKINFAEANIQVAFIDFDDTLVIHLNRSQWSDWFEGCLNGLPDPYLKNSRTAPMPGMKGLLSELADNNIPMFCLTWAWCSIVAKPKERVLDAYYGANIFEGVITTGTRQDKLRFIKRYCEEFCLEPNQVLVVDDHEDTVEECRDYGCKVMTPQEVCCLYT